MTGLAASANDTQVVSVARSTLVVIAGSIVGFVVGIVRQRIVANVFGTSSQFDAYVAADGVSELLVNALAAGTLFYAFVPLYITIIDEKRTRDANVLASQVINLLFICLAIIAGIVALAAPLLVTAPWGIGAGYDPSTQLLTVQILRLLLLSTILFAISSILTGILHAHKHFWLPALAPIMYHLGIILGSLLLAPTLGVFGLAWGAVIGAALHLTIQLPGVMVKGFRWMPLLGWKDPLVHRVAMLMAPRIIDLFMARASITWLNSNLNSFLGEGRVSAVSYAYRVMNIPWTLVGTALGFAIFPYLAAIAASKDPEALRRIFNGGIRAVLVLTIPCAVGLVVLGSPLIQVLFEGGSFDAQSTRLVYFALQFYVLALVSQSLLEIVVRSFAAQQDTLTPLIVSVFTTALNIVLAIWLTRSFAEGGLEHGGAPFANGVAVLVESLIGIAILRSRWGSLGVSVIVEYAIKASVAAACMAVTILLVGQLTSSNVLILVAGSIVGGTTYLIVAYLLGIKEIKEIPLKLVASFPAIAKMKKSELG